LRQPLAERPRLGRLLPLVPAQVHREADDDLADVLVLHDLLEKAFVVLAAGAPVRRQRRGDLAVGGADGQAAADRPVIDGEQTGKGAHRYFSSPFFLSNSTSCFTPASSRRSATSVTSPSCTIRRFSTPTVAIRWPESAAITQFFDFSPVCDARTVFPSASCGCIRSSASQLPTSSQRNGACTISTSFACSITA